MPYRSLTSDIGVRFSEANTLLNMIKANENSVIPPATEQIEHKILKGLFYISLYACIEYTFNQLTIQTLTLIKEKSVPYNHFDTKFLTIALSSNLQSVRDCNSKSFLEKASDMFYLTESTSVANFDETFINKYLQNVWGKSFNQLTKTFGISNFPITPREITIFNEIVDNRNIVGHGRDLAQTIGSSPKYTDLKSKYDTVFDTINRYISHYESYYTNKEYIKTSSRTSY
ncbi:MAE_28990/MAE_18760 family HEPN-like nuclease [Rufibacter immobilis]|uniref:MAE_28990/MAE_18760 family HEPN-like nuclease n=1 Tax=Rufibacter immobilis TaxID=1348778 RepID=UPI0035EA3A1C